MRHNDIMPNVKIKTEKLLSALKINLKKHIEDVKEAQELRRIDIRKYFINIIKGIDTDDTYQPSNTISFPEPCNHSHAYDKAIKMAEMSEDDIIELDDSQFDKLVMDNWEWKYDLEKTTAFYKSRV